MSKPASGGKPPMDPRVTALRRFAISITIFNIVGYIYLGFEQPWTWPFIAIATGYTMELGLETIAALAERRRPRYLGGGVRGLVEYLYPAHITSLAVNMLLYVNDQLLVMIFGVMVGISGKWVLQAPIRGRFRHYMNPSNLGIAVVLLVFPWASIAPPYHFTEHLFGWTDWIIPVVIVLAGSMLNGMLTKRMWLIWSWIVVFALQAVIRGVLFDTAIPSALLVMTGVAFILFTNYMIPDPGTTPTGKWSQIAFGGSTAVLYGFYTGLHVAYGLFFALVTVCLARGLFLWALEVSQRVRQREAAAAPPAAPVPAVPEPVVVGREVLRT
jgi:hypothetical protein